MRLNIFLSITLCLCAVGYSLFWVANKAILLGYHPHMADLHWLLRFWLPIGFVDITIPIVFLIASIIRPNHRRILLIAGLICLFGIVLFQELTLAEVALQL